MAELPDKFAAWFAAKGVGVAGASAGDAGGGGAYAAHRADRRRQDARGVLPSLVDLAAGGGDGLHTLYVSPLKALATDIARNLMAPVEEMGLRIRIETRSGDTPSDRRARQRVNPPDILLTTPESLLLLLSDENAGAFLAG